MRGGLDDALERLARRDELRRRAAEQADGTPAAVTELVEAVAAVVARNPELAITMGVEGVGDPVLLTFALDDGIVQVSADSPVTAQVTEAAPATPRHADFDLDLDPIDPDVLEPDVLEPDVLEPDRADHYMAEPYLADTYEADPYIADPYVVDPAETYRTYAAPAPPSVPPQSRREAYPAPRQQPLPPPMPTPMPQGVEPEATELAAKRLAAMLREDPSLLQPNPLD